MKKNFQLETMREEANARALLMSPVPLSAIELGAKSHLKWDGMNFNIAPKAFTDLMNILGVTSDGGAKLLATGDRGVELLGLMKSAILAAPKKGTKRRVPNDVVFAVDRNQTLQRVYNNKSIPKIFHNGYFDVLERYLNTAHDGTKFVIDNFAAGLDGTISTNIIVDNREFQVGNLKDEVFKPGVTLRLTHKGIVATPYTYRLICTNGAVLTESMGTSWSMDELDGGQLEKWTAEMAKFEALGYHDPLFDTRVLKAINTPASYAETTRVRTLLDGAIGEQHVDGKRIEDFVDLKPLESAYAKANINTHDMGTTQRKLLRTNNSVWDLLNQVTDFASHDYGWNVSPSERIHLQSAAGSMLMRDFDCEHAVQAQAF